MRESNWHKRIISFKRRVVSALARTATVTAGKQQTNQGLPASRPRLPTQRAEIGGSPASCHPAVVGPDGPQADDEPRIENTGLQGLLPASTADGTPTKEPPPDPVAPVSGAEAKDYWLMDTQRLTLDSLPRPTLYWDAARIGLLEYLPAAAAEDCQRLLTIADSENVISPVTDTLRYAGIVKKNGELRRRVAGGLKIVHTGDMILNIGQIRPWLNTG